MKISLVLCYSAFYQLQFYCLCIILLFLIIIAIAVTWLQFFGSTKVYCLHTFKSLASLNSKTFLLSQCSVIQVSEYEA